MSKKYEAINGSYVVRTRDGRVASLPVERHEELIREYSVEKKHQKDINQKFGFTLSSFEIYKRGMGITRNCQMSPDKLQNPKISEETSSEGSLEEVLKKCSIDQSKWEVDDFNVKQLSGGNFIWTVYLKKNISAINKFNIEEFKKELKDLSPYIPKFTAQRQNTGLLWECAIFDAHIGKLALASETGNDYDIKIASKIYSDAVDFSISQSKNFKIEKVVFPIGQDFLHVDNGINETTKGTRQDTDGKSTKIFVLARKLLIETIEKLKMIAPVDVICSPGNHETNSMFHLGDCIECRFWNDENVNVFNQPISRKYYQWGKNLIGYAHGDKTKINDLAVLMATESPKMWSATKYRFWRLGHYHHQKLYVDEKSGVIIEVLPSISATDYWHAEQGYTKNIRGAVSSLFDKENGLIGKFYFNL